METRWHEDKTIRFCVDTAGWGRYARSPGDHGDLGTVRGQRFYREVPWGEPTADDAVVWTLYRGRDGHFYAESSVDDLIDLGQVTLAEAKAAVVRSFANNLRNVL